MTTQRMRTPRKEKIWIGRSTIVQNAITVRAITDRPLAQGLTDLGISKTQGVTVMRVFGRIKLVDWSSGAVTPAYAQVKLGFVWLPAALANAGLDDAQIPVPMANGVREVRWIQQGLLGGLEREAPKVLGTPLEPVEESIWNVDITQMSKQPTIDHELCLVQNGPGTVEADTTAIDIDLQIMLALA